MSGLSDPRTSFGIHSVTPYSRTDGIPYGILKVLKESSISLAGDLIELMGGANKYPWQIETGKIVADMSLKFHEYPDFVFTIFFGITPTPFAAEATGSVGTLTAIKGSLIGTTGVASVALTSGQSAKLKLGRYVIVAKTSSTVDVYQYSDVDFGRGAALGTYVDDTLKIASGITIVSAAVTVLTNFGIDITGGSGTIGMTIGDSAYFEVRPISTGSGGSSVVVGSPNNVVPEWGALIIAQKQGTGALFEIDAFRVKASGVPFGFAEKAFSEVDVKAKLLYDSAKDGVYKMLSIYSS